MRKLVLLLLAAVMCLLPAWLALADGNLLENPGFDVLDSQGLPMGWDTDAYLSDEIYTQFIAS